MNQDNIEQRGSTKSSTTPSVLSRSMSESAITPVRHSTGDVNDDGRPVAEDEATSDGSSPPSPGEEGEAQKTRGRNISGVAGIGGRRNHEWGNPAPPQATYFTPPPQPRGHGRGPGTPVYYGHPPPHAPGGRLPPPGQPVYLNGPSHGRARKRRGCRT
ncbi:hypothetical protein CALCODRAFT_557075 [Calocera cornea HHB12733]|uniref:Uncharacterized protein n=1 Tax=Calocera cornea HHB12733 TaxID=1353952 RepID=A0A165E7P4_9BASI|nr:hypothetical protein CALCODRAFT_557075 [Calocera cornea HHB12733]